MEKAWATSKKKKSAAQLRRLEKRARERGEEYSVDRPKQSQGGGDKEKQNDSSSLARAAAELQARLGSIQADSSLNSKDRRSAKRKAEAIAAEQAGMTSGADLRKRIEAHAAEVAAAAADAMGPTAAAASTNANRKEHENSDLSQESKVDLGRIAVRLKLDLEAAQADESLKSKERRSAKRKAEAVAAEEANLESAESLWKWLVDHSEEAATIENTLRAEDAAKKEEKEIDRNKSDPTDSTSKSAKTPFVVFVGQLSYHTTAEGLRQHIVKFLKDSKDDEPVPPTTVRLLTHADSGKSRGMAFVQFQNGQHCQDCIDRVHHTVLDGRRLNVERTSGGGGRERRRQRLQHSRTQQSLQTAETVQQLFDHYGKIATDEWDENVRNFCQRHSVVVVRQALEEYCQTKLEKQKDGMKDVSPDKPSAYLTHMVNRIAHSHFKNVAAGEHNSAPATKKQKLDSTATTMAVSEDSMADE